MATMNIYDQNKINKRGKLWKEKDSPTTISKILNEVLSSTTVSKHKIHKTLYMENAY